MPQRRLRVVKNNRTQILLFSILTLILTAATRPDPSGTSHEC